MKKQLLFILMMLLPMVAGAEEPVLIDGIYYNLDCTSKEAEVTNKTGGTKEGQQSYSGNVVIPASVTYDGVECSVTRIGNYAFEGCSDLTSVTIPNGVTKIGGYAFRNCSRLASVTIPSSLTSIDANAFSYCDGLTAVHISDIAAWCKISFYNPVMGEHSYANPLYYAHHLYLGEEEIKDLVIPSSVTSIRKDTFEGCSGLTSVTIPSSVTSIGGMAFLDCSGLTSVTIPNSVKSIGGWAFSGCSGLTSVTIPNGVTKVDDCSFSDCSRLTSVTIPNSVTSIGISAFQHCSGLTSITIPNSVTSIGAAAFNGCYRLTSVTIPNNVTSIGEGAFSGCSGLTSVTIPNSVTSLKRGTFSGCTNLTSVTIGSGVKDIGSQAFARCKELTDVYCLAEEVPSTNANAFQDSYIEYATLHVPTASFGAYKTKEPWKSIKTIMGLDGTMPQKCATPTISYGGKKLVFSCATDGVEYVSEIKDVDVRKFYDSEASLSATYEISVYAMKAGWEDSNVATAMLVWGSATLTETTPEELAVRTVTREVPALVISRGGTIAVQSEAEGLPVAVYAADGQLHGVSTVSNGQATVSTNLQPGSIAIVKIGQKAVKVVVK